MKKVIISSLVILFVLGTVFISGCITSQNEKMIYEYSFNHNSTNVSEFNVLNVTLPNGTQKIRVEYQNLSSGNYSIDGNSSSQFEVILLNTILPEEQLSFFNETNIINVRSEIIDIKRVQIENNTLSGSLNFTKSGVKSLIIHGFNIKGNIKVYVA